jgi:hypothetical protein
LFLDITDVSPLMIIRALVVAGDERFAPNK